MRIYIGGVSPSVTADDIEKTFSSLGSINDIELIRSNARNFAYMNFEPNSEKTLSKLFSTYNGCTWKGGKLKLERAKEHYMERLKREWAEDAKLMSEPPVHLNVEKDAVSSKLERLNLENMQLRIFFPKLRTVKSLPFKGTGKHKYSFQRIEVPPLPIHFCDCEEHGVHSEAASVDYISSLNSGVHYEKELSVMNSVMNKLFNKENNENVTEKETTVAARSIMDLSISDKHGEKSEEALEMETDNLVTNIGIGRLDDTLMHLKEGGSLACNKESRAGKHHPVKKESRSMANNKKRKIAGPGDSVEVVANEIDPSKIPFETTENEFTAILPLKTSSVGYFQQEPEISAEPLPGTGQPESNTTIQSKSGKSWLQKSSWRDLVGELGSTSFSITDVLPDISSLPPKELKLSNSAIEAPTTETKVKSLRVGQRLQDAPPALDLPSEKVSADGKMPAKGGSIQANTGFSQNKGLQKSGAGQESWRIISEVGASEVCTFMRTAESERQWSKARAVLSRRLKKNDKRKNDENDSYKRTRPHKR